MSKYVHLHVHTDYSDLDGTIQIQDLCRKAAALGMTALAITDHGTLAGALDFYLACKAHNIKPIIGCEFYSCRDHTDASTKDDRYHLVLLAADNTGYRNIYNLSSISYESDYFYRKPRIDLPLLQQYSAGLICLSGCMSGYIPKALAAGNPEGARQAARELAAIFPKRFYLELQKNGLPEQDNVNTKLIELARAENLPLVSTADCHCLDRQDQDLEDIAICIRTGKTLKGPNRLKSCDDIYLKSPEAMRRQFKDIPEAIANTAEIARQCNVDIETDKHCFPVFPLPEGVSADERLDILARAGLQKKGLVNEPAYTQRLEHELAVIKDCGFASYMLIVEEYVSFARKQGIAVGPGRGSAAGSLVCYALGITEIDPVRWNLLFERFLNPERVSLPDIDVDFCEQRRDEVIQHMRDMYGADHVAQLPAFSTLKARSAIKDVGRAMGRPTRIWSSSSKRYLTARTLKRLWRQAKNWRPYMSRMPPCGRCWTWPCAWRA